MVHRVVVIGGGAGGLSASNRLALLADSGAASLEVVLVDRARDHVFAPGFVAVMFGEAEPEVFRRPLAALLRPAVRLVTGQVDRIDVAGRTVAGGFGDLPYDSLVLALGAEVGWAGGSPLGVEASPWTEAGALGGRRLLSGARRSDRLLVTPATPVYRCPPAVFDLAVRLKVATASQVTVAHPWARPLAPFGEEPSRRFSSMLDRAGVGFRGGFSLDRLGPGLATPAEGDAIEFDAAVVVPPHRPPALIAASSLAGPLGWMSVTYPGLHHPDHREIYGVGDVVAPTLGVGMAGTLAVLEGVHVADRIAAGAGGRPAPDEPHMAAICFVDTGDTGSFLHCDFSGPASGSGPARCTLMPDLPYFRRAKRLFAEEWFASTVWGGAG